MTTLLSEINIAHFHQYLFYRLLYPALSPNGLPIVATTSFRIIHLKSYRNYFFRILTFYYESTKTCYSYCLESDICIHSQDKILKSIEGAIWGTIEFFIHLSYNENTFYESTLQQRNKVLELEQMYQIIDRFYLNSIFFPIENLHQSLYHIESQIPYDSQLESYKCYTLMGQKITRDPFSQ
ncbi:MAG: hypothetical protein ACRCWI_03685 [Brevinema sp.]